MYLVLKCCELFFKSDALVVIGIRVIVCGT